MSLFEEVEDDLWMENALKDNTEDDIFGDSLFSDDITSLSSSNKKDKKVFHALGTKDLHIAKKKQEKLDKKYESDVDIKLSTEKNDLSKSILNQQFKSNRTTSQQIKNENELIDSRAGVIAKESDVTDEISTIRKGIE